MARHCRNRGGMIRIGKERRLEYRRERTIKHSNNLKEEENPESLN